MVCLCGAWRGMVSICPKVANRVRSLFGLLVGTLRPIFGSLLQLEDGDFWDL